LTCDICPSGHPTNERRIVWRSKFGREIIQARARAKFFPSAEEIEGENTAHGMEEVNSAIDKATQRMKTLGIIQPIVNPKCPATNCKSTLYSVFHENIPAVNENTDVTDTFAHAAIIEKANAKVYKGWT